MNCRRQNEPCDYSIRLNWGGRTRRTSSVDSPSSLSSSFSIHTFSFPLSPPDISQTQPASPVRPVRSSMLEENNSLDSPQESLGWESVLAGEMTLGRTYPTRLPDIQDPPTVPDQSLSPPSHTTDRVPVEMDLSGEQDLDTWPGGSLSREGFPNDLSIPSSLDNPHYPPVPDINPNIHVLPDFNFPSGLVTQPISFVRPALRAPEYAQNSPFEQNDVVDFSGSPPVGMGLTGASDCNTLSPSDSHGALSPRSLDTSVFLSGTPRDQAETPDSFLAGILDGSPGCDAGRAKRSRTESSYPRLRNDGIELNENCGLSISEKKWHAYLQSVTDHYGMDCGRPDGDLGNNDDHSAIDVNEALDMLPLQTTSRTSSPGNTSGDGTFRRNDYDYYALPVPINIPRYLSPLPSSLLKVPINLMYFHHFLNHTARVLVPHDCTDNPFSSVLPSMAINDSNLLNLMLAYSASHRARFLGHPEPTHRIAHWVRNVFPSLRIALEDSQENITDSHLATAIMLLSLKIVSPSTFEVPIPWQSHLKLARDLFLARQAQMACPNSRVGAFLTRWLGYLDILGSLSCRYHQPPLLAYYSVLRTCSAVEDWDEFAVDCLTGFSPRTGLFLMKLGDLVNQCDNERFDDMGNFMPEWGASSDILFKAETLIADWETLDARAHAHRKHYLDSESSDMIAVDSAFRYAGLIQLRRRVLGDSSASEPVLEAIEGLMKALATIRSGSAVEAGILFPIFTAGCELQDLEKRNEIKERLDILEGTGLKQFRNARTLMQRCWDTNMPWIAFAQGEFIG
ncbi:fungal-specific transcription factor domain-containing protein [Aspergillus crustosus]